MGRQIDRHMNIEKEERNVYTLLGIDSLYTKDINCDFVRK